MILFVIGDFAWSGLRKNIGDFSLWFFFFSLLWIGGGGGGGGGGDGGCGCGCGWCYEYFLGSRIYYFIVLKAKINSLLQHVCR